MTSRTAMAVARDAMSITKNKTSRCKVVIPDDSIEESFAIRPLDKTGINFASEKLSNSYAQDRAIPSLDNQAYARTADTVSSLQRDVLGLDTR